MTAACATFIDESRIKRINATQLHRKSGVWGTRGLRWDLPYGLSLVKTWSLEMSLNITNAAKISNTTKAAW